jgi:glutamine synthetase
MYDNKACPHFIFAKIICWILDGPIFNSQPSQANDHNLKDSNPPLLGK